MVPVGDVERVNRCEGIDKIWYNLGIDLPNRVTHSIERSEINKRLLARTDTPGQLVHLRVRTMGQKDRTSLCAQLDHMPGAIVFLVRPCALVLLDHVAVVLGE